MKTVCETIFETDKAARIYRSIQPELERIVSDRSTIELTQNDHSLKLRICADDLVSMRSTLNTWLRLVKIAHEVSYVVP
ncbi:MAG: KEOPS complex subunit Pcc1 [Euryarchaeota archaeon]|nr:KEOPS complex subunit Pcc1 [Euryarchaeota archaeon]